MVSESRSNTRFTFKVERNANRDLRCAKKSNVKLPAIKTVPYRLECIRYLGSKDLEASTGIKKNCFSKTF